MRRGGLRFLGARVCSMVVTVAPGASTPHSMRSKSLYESVGITVWSSDSRTQPVIHAITGTCTHTASDGP